MGTARSHAVLAAGGSSFSRLVCELWGERERGAQHPWSLHPPTNATHPAAAQHPASRGCGCKLAFPAKGLLGSGSIQKSAVTSSGHQSQRESPKPDIAQQSQRGIMVTKPPTPANGPRSSKTHDRTPPHTSPQAWGRATGFGDAGTHRARCSDTGHACPGSAPACPSRPRPAP